MKIVWKKKKEVDDKGTKRLRRLELPFGADEEEGNDEGHRRQIQKLEGPDPEHDSADWKPLAEAYRSQGDRLAEDGRYNEALGKWESALALIPEDAILHEQKAQVLLEIGDAWGAVKAATRATELEPSWTEAWITLARAQLNFGEPDASIESFDRALAIKPESVEVKIDRETALHLVTKRQQLHSAGLCETQGRFLVRDKAEVSES